MALTGSRGGGAPQIYSIDDFTPGIYAFTGPGTSYVGAYAMAPPGSASDAFRCYARQGIGLVPLPSYQGVQTVTAPAGGAGVALSLGDMRCLAGRGGVPVDIVSSFLIQNGPGISNPTTFQITRCAPSSISPSNIASVIYSSSATTFPINTTSWPLMDFGAFRDPTSQKFARCVITTDPISTSPGTTGGTGTWVTVRGWTTPTTGLPPDFVTGSFPLQATATYPRVFYHETRMGIWQIEASTTATNSYTASDCDIMQVSDPPYSPTISTSPTTNINVFFPEMGTIVDTWGSISTGEYVGIYREGGAFLLYGDLIRPDSSQKLPGVTGAGGIVGPAALTPIGLIYPRFNGQAYLWNGDNTSTNIAPQIPNGQLQRTPTGQGFAPSPQIRASNCVWGDWVFFPNNWMLDTLTRGWWRCEDVNVNNFQVHAYSGQGVGMVSSPGVAYSFNPGKPAALTTVLWDYSIPASSWFWQSNPLPVTVGNLVTLLSVEIIASNLSATAATITVQPTTTQGTAPTANSFQNQNDNFVTFDIPAHTSGYRARQRLGFNDYNIALAVNAANSNTSNAAPTLHSIHCEYSPISPSGVTP